MATYKRPDGAYDLMTRLDGADLSLTERAVLLAQYKFGDKDGTNSYVGEERLAEYLNTSDRTVRRTRKSLRDKGWLVERERGHNLGDKPVPSLYWVVIPTPVPIAATQKPKRVPNPTGRNQHTKASGQICPEAPKQLPDNSTGNPSELQDKINHLPVYRSIDDENVDPVGPDGPNSEKELGERVLEVEPSEEHGESSEKHSIQQDHHDDDDMTGGPLKSSALLSSSSYTPGDIWPESFDSAPCVSCSEPVFRDGEYTYRGYLKWHASCARLQQPITT